MDEVDVTAIQQAILAHPQSLACGNCEQPYWPVLIDRQAYVGSGCNGCERMREILWEKYGAEEKRLH